MSAARDREADRARFTDPEFNRWLDEGISDAGHTVWDAVGDVQAAWQGWENRPFYAAPVAPAQAPVLPLDDQRLQRLFGDCIEGALAFGYQGNNKPPEGHWLCRFWNLGRAQAAAQPLTDAQLARIWDEALDQLDTRDQLRYIARAIERAHGIGSQP